MIFIRNTYFAAANTWWGFKSFYSDIFGILPRLYIIKGGPGTGKSSLIKRVADEAEKRDYDVELYLCSSDPNSYDGIIIPKLGIAVIDGTSPHSADTVLPGAKDEIINLGEFWKSDKLRDRYDDIYDLTLKKKREYNTAFAYLSAIGSIENEIKNIVLDAIDTPKLQKYVKRVSAALMSNSSRSNISPRNDTVIRVIDSVGMYGALYLPTFENIASKNYYINDKYGISDILLEELQKSITSYGIKTIKGIGAPSGLINGLLLPDSSVSFTVLNDHPRSVVRDDESSTIIRTERFINNDILKRSKQRIKFAKKCIMSLSDGVAEAFSSIRDIHFEIEKIYGSAMDFKGKEKYTDKIVERIFGK